MTRNDYMYTVSLHQSAFMHYECIVMTHLCLSFGSARLFLFPKVEKQTEQILDDLDYEYRADESNPRYQKIKAMASTRASAQPEFLVQRLLIQKRQAFKGKVEMNILEFYNNAEENVN